jgi:hypothetical protein
MWTWIKLTDESFAALRNAKVPEVVLEKIAILKNKDLTRKDLAREITKALDTIEFELYQELIFIHAVQSTREESLLERLACLGCIIYALFCFVFALLLIPSIRRIEHAESILAISLWTLGILFAVVRILGFRIQKRLPPGHRDSLPEESTFFQTGNKKEEYSIPNIRTRAFWVPLLIWLGFSSVVLGLMIYQVIACSGCFLELLSMIALAIKWKRNCKTSKSSASKPPQNIDSD